MSSLLLIRHGQASLGADDYDRLSPLGEAQGRALGAHFRSLGQGFDRVFVGPKRRHRQTYEAVVSTLEGPLPEPEFLGTFDEHQCMEVLEHHRETLCVDLGLDPGTSRQQDGWRRLFREGSRRWARGELQTPEPFEDWSAFRARIRGDLEDLRSRVTEASSRVVVFTSGGAVAATVGLALGLDDREILELSWKIRNGSLTELHFSSRGLGLSSFNAVPFRRPDLLTYV